MARYCDDVQCGQTQTTVDISVVEPGSTNKHRRTQNNNVNQGDGTEGRNRTGTPVKEPDFESGASTSSATPAFSLVETAHMICV